MVTVENESNDILFWHFRKLPGNYIFELEKLDHVVDISIVPYGGELNLALVLLISDFLVPSVEPEAWLTCACAEILFFTIHNNCY